MELIWWSVAVILFAVGLIGTVLPVFPGTIIILGGALLHRLMLGPDKSIGWKTITVLVLFTLGSYALDFLSGYFGARYFGATKWGMFSALFEALIGIFFGLAGLFVGPVIGAVAGEFIAGKRMIDAGRARLGQFAWESRCNDGQTIYRGRNDHDFLFYGAISALKPLRLLQEARILGALLFFGVFIFTRL